MPRESSPRRGDQILEWFKDRGLLLITLTGVVLYFFLSVPAAIFYGRFGVSAGEVGISYASLLSGSTVEISIIVAILAGALVLAANLLAGLVSLFWTYFIYTPYMLLHAGYLTIWDINYLDDQQFERFLVPHLRIIGRFQWLLHGSHTHHPDEPSSLAAVERKLRDLRDLQKRRKECLTQLNELRKRGLPTATASAQLDLIGSQIKVYNRGHIRAQLLEPFLTTRAAIRRWGRVLLIGLASVTVVALLPILAIIQAGQVLDGKTYFGSNAGAFDYHADLVKVTSSSDHPAPSIQALQGKTMFLLGENTQYAVLYLPSLHSTIRVPISSVVISSVG